MNLTALGLEGQEYSSLANVLASYQGHTRCSDIVVNNNGVVAIGAKPNAENIFGWGEFCSMFTAPLQTSSPGMLLLESRCCIFPLNRHPNEVIMSNIYVEREDDGTYKATQNKKVIARGGTQAETVKAARRKKPDDPVLAERVRNTKDGSRDKWHRVY
jgi:hypothetical protein